jgi:plasmid replication initiation protein
MGNTVKASASNDMIIKAAELIDIVEMSALTRVDRIVFNEMLRNAHNAMDQGREHSIHKAELGLVDRHDERILETIHRLVATQIKIRIKRDGEDFDRVMSILSRVDNAVRKNGQIYYKFSDDVVELIRNSDIFARLKREVLHSLSSKYSLALYEILSKRINLEFKAYEEFEVMTLRRLMGVEDTKLPRFGNFKVRALVPAIEEVNELTEIACSFQEVKNGNQVVGIRLMWWRKDAAALSEVQRARQTTSEARRGRKLGEGGQNT